MAAKTTVPLIVLVAQAVAQTAFALGGASGVNLTLGAPRHVLGCTVTVLDTVSMNFVCQTNTAAHRFWVARSTHFASGPNASFSHLKTGQPVQVTFHNSGHSVADVVRFQP